MTLSERHNVTVRGSGEPTLFFSHGFGCDQSMFRQMVPAFSEEYRTITYDMAGANAYTAGDFRPERYTDLDAYARDAINILDELEEQGVVFIGHSVSAMIGVLVANARPDLVDSLVLIGPSPRYINDGEYVGGFSKEDIDELLETMADNYLGWSRAMAPAIMGNADRPHLGEELTSGFCKTDPDAARQFAAVTFRGDNREDLAKLRQPALVIQATEDIIAGENVGRYVAANVANGHFRLIEARGHCPHMSAPEATNAAVREFLAGRYAPAV